MRFFFFPAGDRVVYKRHLLGHLLALPKRGNYSPSCRSLCKVIRTVSFPILTKLNEPEPENAHNYKPKKVACFSWLSITKASTSNQTPFVANFSIKENGQIKVTVVVKQRNFFWKLSFFSAFLNLYTALSVFAVRPRTAARVQRTEWWPIMPYTKEIPLCCDMYCH